MFEIIKNAELPKNNRGRGTEYPFAMMEVGDGFDAPRDMGKAQNGSDKRQNVVSTSARAYARRNNPTAKFTVRILDENTIRCVRVK